MIEKESMNFVIAIGFITTMITLVVGMYGYHLVSSGKRLRNAQRLAAAAIEFTPAFITIVFDERDRVAVLNIQDPPSEAYFREAFVRKNKRELSFLPQALQNPKSPDQQENKKPVAPLKMPNGDIVYLEWEMQCFANDDDQPELRIARGHDITKELLQTQRKLKVLSATSIEVEERERKRIAEDLHDRIGEILMTSAHLLDELKKKSPSQEISRGLDELDLTIDKFIGGTRSLIFDLVPPVLYNVGLAAAVKSLATDFKKQQNLSIRVEDGWGEFQVNQEIAIFFLKAIREFIMNARVHGGADEILVSLNRTEDTLEVLVEDNGSGFVSGSNTITSSAESGFGLFNVKNRAEYYRGGINISDSVDLKGALIKVWVPQPSQNEKGVS